MKAMHIDAVINFPFPTPPNRDALRKAEKTLTHLGALQSLGDAVVRGTNTAHGGKITDLGRSMALFPISPRFSKLLAIGRQKGCLPYVIAMVAGLSVGDPFLREEDVGIDIHDADDEGEDDVSMEVSTLHSDKLKEKEIRKSRRRAYFKAMQLHSKLGNFTSDVFRILSVVGAYEYDGGRSQFCDEHFVRPKAMEEIHKLRAQLSHIVQTNFTDADEAFSPKLPPPDATQIKVLRQLLAAAFIDRVAVRKDVVDKDSTTSGLKFASCRGVAYRAMDIDEDVFIHPSSVVYHGTPPDWIVYQDIVRSSRVWMKGITTINPAWLPTLGPTFCTFSKPLDLPLSLRKIGADIKVVTPHFGPHRWQLPNTKI
ncbi:putative ATP-dependent RNA helicase DHR1 [Tulasnella sp. 403]|nr:putative ATP-dependent RNA helicase DHR1 [Tulasnella sp. 403]